MKMKKNQILTKIYITNLKIINLGGIRTDPMTIANTQVCFRQL